MSPKRMTTLELWGKELARAREAAGMTQEVLAKTIHVSASLVAMWETGKRAPKHEYVRACDNVLRTGGFLFRLLDEWVPLKVSPEWLDKWLLVEEQATTLLWFEPVIIPGLLQTEDYARAVLRAGKYYLADTEEMVAARLDRQRILDLDNPPFLVAVLDESVLMRNVGDARVMADQLMHLGHMAERPNVVVQIAPLSAPACAGFLSTFIIASFDGGNEAAYADNQLSGDVIESLDDVATLRQLFERFRADALSQHESIDLIRKVVAEKWPIT